MKNNILADLTLSAYLVQAPSVAAANAPLVASGKTALLNNLPTGKDLNLRVANYSFDPTRLTSGSNDAVFRIHPDRSYVLDFYLDFFSVPGHVIDTWSWDLATDPYFEAYNLSAKPAGAGGLTLAWKDPPMADLQWVWVFVDNYFEEGYKMPKGAETLTLTDLSIYEHTFTLVVEYPEIDSNGINMKGTPVASIPKPKEGSKGSFSASSVAPQKPSRSLVQTGQVQKE